MDPQSRDHLSHPHRNVVISLIKDHVIIRWVGLMITFVMQKLSCMPQLSGAHLITTIQCADTVAIDTTIRYTVTMVTISLTCTLHGSILGCVSYALTPQLLHGHSPQGTHNKLELAHLAEG